MDDPLRVIAEADRVFLRREALACGYTDKLIARQVRTPPLAAGATYYICCRRGALATTPPATQRHLTLASAVVRTTPGPVVLVQNGPTRIGHVTASRSTAATPTRRSPGAIPRRPAARPGRACDDTLGMMGPVIRAVVGDTIKVVFRNNTSFPASIHPHGVFYAKNAEGAPYADGTGPADKADDAVGAGRHLHLHLEGARAGRAGADGRLLRAVDVPLAHRRDRRHQRRPDRPDGDHRARQGRRGDGHAARRGPRDLHLLHRREREREPAPRPEPRSTSQAHRTRSSPATRRASRRAT